MKRSRKSTTAVLAVTVVTAGAVVGLWWKPWLSPLSLPKSACWGILGPSDIRPLVGPDGTADSATRGNLVPPWLIPPYPQGHPYPLGNLQTRCNINWNDITVVAANIWAYDDNGLKGIETQTMEKLMPLTPGVSMLPASDNVTMVFRCDRLRPKYTYAVVQVSSVNDINNESIPTETQRNGYANIALKLAKVAAPQINCKNSLNFPAVVPKLAPYPH